MKSINIALTLLVVTAVPTAAQSHLLIVSGLGGEARYVEEFHGWGTTMVDAATERLRLPRDFVTYLAENPERDPGRIDGISRREQVEEAIGRIAERAGPSDRIMILLIGHGSADSRGARINLPGPDLTADRLDELLEAFTTQPIVVVNTASASGDFQEPLAGENRTIITATRSGMERNETMFGGFFVAAFADDGADADKDDRVSIAEAYEYAVAETERAYENENRLQLEHARMEGDEGLAQRFHLAANDARIPTDVSEEVRTLYETRQKLEEDVALLRAGRDDMEEARYRERLEELLLELARTNRAIQDRGGGDR